MAIFKSMPSIFVLRPHWSDLLDFPFLLNRETGSDNYLLWLSLFDTWLTQKNCFPSYVINDVKHFEKRQSG